MNGFRQARALGFTLIELSLALAAGATILVAIYGIFSRTIHMRNAATEMTREIRVRTHVANVIRNDLRGARVSGGSMAAFLTGTVQGQSGAFPGYLKFTTTSARDIDNGDDLANADVQQVEYYITSDPASQDPRAGLLVRTVNTNLLAPVQDTPPEDPLLAGIESMEIMFFDGTDWQPSWSATQDDPTNLPQAVRVRLQPVAAVLNGPKPPVIEILVPWTTQASIDPTAADPPPPDDGGGGTKPPAPAAAPSPPSGAAAPR